MTLAWIAFTYLIAPYVVWTSLLGTRAGARHAGARLCALVFALTPPLLGWLALSLLAWAPGASPAQYRWGVAAPFLALALVRRRSLGLGWHALRQALPPRPWIRPMEPVVVLLALFVVAGMVELARDSGRRPLIGNDALEYATLARRFFELRTSAFYPMLAADPTTGFYTPMTHPLGYPGLIYWSYLVQGHAAHFGAAKLVVVWAALMTLVLLWVGQRERALARWAGPALLLVCPVWTDLVSATHHVDPLLALAFLAAASCLDECARRPARLWWALLGLAVGECMLAHSLGLFAPAAFGVLILALAPARRLQAAVGVVALAVVVGGAQYVENVRVRGRPAGDDNPIWQIEELRVDEWFKEDRGLRRERDRVVNGYFQVWAKPAVFGVAPWAGALALAGLVVTGRGRRARVELGLFALFYAVLFGLTFLRHSDLLIRNVRYFVWLMPLFAAVAARAVGEAEAFLPEPAQRRRLGVAVFVAVFALGVLRATRSAVQFYEGLTDPEHTWRLRDDPTMRMVDHVRRSTPPDALLFVFRMGDFAFYSERRLLVDLDPSLVDFYRLTDPVEAHRQLRARGVSYIVKPAYPYPTFDNSAVARLVADERLASLEEDIEGWRLFRLLP